MAGAGTLGRGDGDLAGDFDRAAGSDADRREASTAMGPDLSRSVLFTRGNRLVDRLYLHQKVGGGGAALGGKLDLYRVFAERMVGLLCGDGAIGMVVPSAFHANEGATGIRKLFLQHTRVERCLSFENRK